MSLREMLNPKVVELGSVRIGTLGPERTSGNSGRKWRPPVKLDHFIVTGNVRDASGQLIQDKDLMDRLSQEWGDQRDGKLRQIPITLLSDEIEDSLRSAYVHYRGKVCLARSDGVKLWKYADLKTGQMLKEPQELDWNPEWLNSKFNDMAMFKKHTVLDFVIRNGNARWGGVYRFRTTSMITGDQLYGSLLHLQRLTNGVMTGMPLMLVIRPMQVAPDGRPTTVYVVHVELHGADLEQLQMRALEVAKFQKTNLLEMRTLRNDFRKLMREPGSDEDEYTTAEIQQEFHPDDVDAGVVNEGMSTDLNVDISTSLDMGDLGDDTIDATVEPVIPQGLETPAEPAAAAKTAPAETPAATTPATTSTKAAKPPKGAAKSQPKAEASQEQTPPADPPAQGSKFGPAYEKLLREVELCVSSADAAQLAKRIGEARSRNEITEAGADDLAATLRGDD